MSYGIFESAATDNLEQEARQRQALGALDMAILSVRDSQGGWVTAAETKEDFEDRIALVKDDMRKSVEAHLMPVTGVMRKVVKALRDDWFDAHKARTAADSDKDRPELIPDGDFDGYLNEVDEGADGSHNFEPAEHDDTPKRGSAKTAAGWLDSGEFANYADSELEQAFWDTEGGPDHQKVVNEYENRDMETPSDEDDWDDEHEASVKESYDDFYDYGGPGYEDSSTPAADGWEQNYEASQQEWHNGRASIVFNEGLGAFYSRDAQGKEGGPYDSLEAAKSFTRTSARRKRANGDVDNLEGYDDNSHEWKNSDGLTEEEAILKEFYPDEWAKRNSKRTKSAADLNWNVDEESDVGENYYVDTSDGYLLGVNDGNSGTWSWELLSEHGEELDGGIEDSAGKAQLAAEEAYAQVGGRDFNSKKSAKRKRADYNDSIDGYEEWCEQNGEEFFDPTALDEYFGQGYCSPEDKATLAREIENDPGFDGSYGYFTEASRKATRKQATGFATEEIEDMKNWAYQFGYISDTVLPTISSEDVLSIIKKDYPGGLIAWQQDGATQSPLDDVTMDMGMEPAPAADEVFASRDKTASDAQSLVDLCTRFDNGDQSVTVDQYDDALEQLEGLAEDGDSTASSYVDAY